MTVKNVNIKKSSNNELIDRVMLWILFGVILSALPTFLTIMYKIIIGMRISYMEYAPDILIVLMAVCCNFMSLCVDNEKKILRFLRWLFGVAMVIIILFCWGLYSLIYFNTNPRTLAKIESYMPMICKASLCIIGFCFFTGIIIEIITSKGKYKYN